MKFSLFPIERQIVKVKIPKDILIKELSRYIDFGGSGIIWFKKTEKSFAGYKNGERYDVILKTTYRNSFKPRVQIEFYEKDDMTELNIEYKLDVVVKVFSIVFISILSIIQLIILYYKYNEVFAGNTFEYLFPLGMIFLLLIFSRLGFYMSLDHSENTISKLIIMLKRKYGLLEKRSPGSRRK